MCCIGIYTLIIYQNVLLIANNCKELDLLLKINLCKGDLYTKCVSLDRFAHPSPSIPQNTITLTYFLGRIVCKSTSCIFEGLGMNPDDESNIIEPINTRFTMCDTNTDIALQPQLQCDHKDNREDDIIECEDEGRTWKSYVLQFGIILVGITLGFVVSHYFTLLFVGGGVLVKAGVGAKLTAAVHHIIHLRTVGGQCCCCSCGGCNGCCPCGDACCSCIC